MELAITYQSKFIPILKELVKLDKPHQLDINTVHVTEVTQCLRKSFLMRKEGEALLSKEIFEGKSIHHYISYLIEKYRKGIESEVEYEVDLGLLCKVLMKPDVILDDRVVEIKTTELNKIARPFPEHELQANFYAFVLNKPFYEIVYIKRKGEPIAFVEHPDVKMFFHVVRRIELYHNYLLKDELPEMETKYCHRCPFYYKCYHQAKLEF